MPLPTRRPSAPRHLTASAAQVGSSDGTKGRERRTLGWQERALAVVDIVPELAFSSRFYSRNLKQLRIYPASVDERGRETAIEEGPPVELLAQLKDKAGTHRQILANYGRLMFSTGEGLLCGFNIDNPKRAFWNFLWNKEVKVERESDGTVKKVLHYPNGRDTEPVVYGPQQARVYRMWSSHPRSSGEADSPMRSTLDIADELIVLTAAVRATAVSRTGNGLLLIPQEIAPPPVMTQGDEDPENDIFSADLQARLEWEIENAGTAAAASPYVLYGRYDFIDKIRKIELHNTANDYAEIGLRKEAVERLARGLDFPPEALLGLGNSNHWAALQILWDMWRSHGAPVAQQFCDDLNDAYLRPSLEAAGYADWQNVVICYDDAEILARPDRGDDADMAAKLGYIGGVGYRSMKNIPEEFAQTQEEHEEWLAIQMRNPQILPEDERPDVGAPPEPNIDAQAGPPPPGPEGDSGRRTRIVTSSSEREVGAAELALARCRELAGIRIRQKERLCPDCVQRANGSPNSEVPALVGPELIEKLQLNPSLLVRGGADTLSSMLATWGYGEIQAKALSELVEAFAARTLFEARQPALPVGFAAHIERAREASSNGHH